MMDVQAYLLALALILGVGIIAWGVSVAIRNVAFVDSLWSLFFLTAAIVFAASAWPLGARGLLVTVLVAIWALRLSIYITARNWGEPEDYRYQKIRANNEPGFAFKSLYIVFGLQGVLAWFIAMPLVPAIMSPGGIGPIELVATALWVLGFVFEAGGDYQLARFKRDPANEGRVLNSGLWRYTRHPNYFGDFCVWWAFYLFAFSAGGWWTALSPVLMSLLLLKVSGVALLEKTITETNAFFPGAPKSASAA
jgi:steroid 5-alpha reductase family enzyme